MLVAVWQSCYSRAAFLPHKPQKSERTYNKQPSTHGEDQAVAEEWASMTENFWKDKYPVGIAAEINPD
ncbi:hypothetical protein, partial [Pseudomonas sp.]|uniref:hypothetical protein n=1 Tax=Pseudomonas sp. TaxID=306 RepID=UPI003BB53C7D